MIALVQYTLKHNTCVCEIGTDHKLLDLMITKYFSKL